MFDFAPHLDSLYGIFAQEVVRTPKAGGPAQTGLAVFNRPGVAVVGGDVLATDYSLTYRASTFPVVVRGDSFSIGGESYTAREDHQSSRDGLEYSVPLSRVQP